MILRRVLPLLAALGGLMLARPSFAQESELVDLGRFIVYEHGTPVAHEDFEYRQFGDSLVIIATTTRKMKRQDGTTVEFYKEMGLIANASDFDLIRYSSSQGVGPDTTRRGIVPGDTAFTAFVETPAGGGADRLVRPPGRLFVLDGQLWTLIDVVGRNVYRQSFDSRPVAMVAFSDPPAVIEATIRRMPADTLRWGAKRVVTQCYEIGDANMRFRTWVGPDGHLLKLEQAESQLRVMREPPKVVPAARRRPR